MTKVDVGGMISSPDRRRLRVSPALAWFAVAPFVLWTAGRLTGVDRRPLIVELMTVTPYVAAASLGAVLIALASRSRAAIAVSAATSTLLATMVLPRAFATAPTATGATLKILTTNMYFGGADARTIVDLVRRLKPDILSTQELTPAAVEALDAAGLEESLPYSHNQAAFGAYGSGLWSRYPLTPVRDFALPESRNMPRARVAVPGAPPVEIVDVHTVSPVNGDVYEWLADMESLPAPSSDVIRILAGDFNASLDHSPLRAVIAGGYADAGDATGTGLNTTWPADWRIPPVITIDHVLYDERASAVAADVHTVPGTDHRALFAELRLPKEIGRLS
ncbi:endonuclease/exonuclease/phosphatase family protein [Planotetraspora phitsanulokensis]|uniref:endonuclease/exonuclease/phosphatase family protein n=1 Tax=Planotetraspora phitsanulokensis TaxID=575192 RepID=UPI0019522EF7|nr:endonuclease/exonuclease/phosphatase family protein [Planotetraspora phitsanulokensis]